MDTKYIDLIATLNRRLRSLPAAAFDELFLSPDDIEREYLPVQLPSVAERD